MTQSRQEDNWNHTAALLSMLANANRDPKKGRAFKPADFHPALPARRKRTASPPPAPLKGDITMLKVFVPPP
ncbi:MAG: hypothetical protein FWD61_01195 [Phycisphaerales bacterium]|nr:hypothetical protein [Phycisphaerales bacterium]